MSDITIQIANAQPISAQIQSSASVEIEMEKQNVNLSAYAKLADLLAYAKLNGANGAFTAPVIINPVDGTADPLSQIKVVSDGGSNLNEYGIDFGTFDLTMYGYGKYITETGRSNGALGDGVVIQEGAIIIGDAVVNAYFGQSIYFFHESDLTFVALAVQWNYDGNGNNRLYLGDDLSINGSLNFVGDLNLQSGANIITQAGSYIKFTGQNNFDGYIQNVWTGGNWDLQITSGGGTLIVDSNVDINYSLGVDGGATFYGGIYYPNIKSGATQAGANAGGGEIWKTASHATLPDNVLLIGV